MKQRHGSRRANAGIALVVALSMLTAACGSDDDTTTTAAPAATEGAAPTAAPTATEAAVPTEAPAATDAPAGTEASAGTEAPAATAAPASTDDASAAAWDAVVAAAKEEGSVTIYSSQSPDNLNALGEKFEDEYGIHVDVFRAIDSDLQAKIQAEADTNSPVADVVVQASLGWEVDKSAAGTFTKLDLPAFDNPDYDAELNVSENGDYFACNGAVLTFGWNTDLWPKGLTDYPDLLDPELKGKIGVIEPAAASIMDFWLYLEDKYGKDFTDKLAAQEPRIYPSSLPMGEALISGEISAASFVQVQAAAKADGAPVDSGLSDPAWGAIFNAAVLANAPHPNAAMLLANFMITAEGQEAISANAAASLPSIESSLDITTDQIRRQDLSLLTPDALAAYQERWNSLFK